MDYLKWYETSTFKLIVKDSINDFCVCEKYEWNEKIHYIIVYVSS